MAEITLNILKPSVNNLTVRVFVRAAGPRLRRGRRVGGDDEPRVPREVSRAPHADDRDGRACRAARSARAARSCSTSATSTASTRFYPTDPGERAMVDNAMFYLIGTFYPLLTRATYPALGFGQYPGEVGDLGGRRRHEGEGAAGRRGRARRAARGLPRLLHGRQEVHRRRLALDRRHPAGRDARVPATRSTTTSRRGRRSTWPRWSRRSARRTRSPPPTCAATSLTFAATDR